MKKEPLFTATYYNTACEIVTGKYLIIYCLREMNNLDIYIIILSL